MTEGDRDRLWRLRAEGLGAAIPGPEVELTGLVHRLDLEGGVWVLDADSGDRFELLGVAGPRMAGRRRVRGRLRPDLVTVGQAGVVLEVLESGDAPVV